MESPSCDSECLENRRIVGGAAGALGVGQDQESPVCSGALRRRDLRDWAGCTVSSRPGPGSRPQSTLGRQAGHDPGGTFAAWPRETSLCLARGQDLSLCKAPALWPDGP